MYPAYSKYLAFLKSDYAPKAREDVGVWATAGGDAAYAFRVRHHTTTNFTPDELHEIGHEELRSILREMQAVEADRAAYERVDLEFHTQIVAIARNQFLTRLLGAIYDQIQVLRLQSRALPVRKQSGSVEQLEIFTAIAARMPACSITPPAPESERCRA